MFISVSSRSVGEGFVRTEATALSKAVEAPPPRLIETMEGRPEERAEDRTKLRPETLNGGEIRYDGERCAHTYQQRCRIQRR